VVDRAGIAADFQVSDAGITPYFAAELAVGAEKVEFLIHAVLIDAPEGRAERVLSELLANSRDLIRFLLLLLGNLDEAFTSFFDPTTTSDASGNWLLGAGSQALLEPLVRAFAREPERLRDVERVLAELLRSPDGCSVLPERWEEIWNPIADALAQRSVS
jgi:hypothetical protein